MWIKTLAQMLEWKKLIAELDRGESITPLNFYKGCAVLASLVSLTAYIYLTSGYLGNNTAMVSIGILSIILFYLVIAILIYTSDREWAGYTYRIIKVYYNDHVPSGKSRKEVRDSLFSIRKDILINLMHSANIPFNEGSLTELLNEIPDLPRKGKRFFAVYKKFNDRTINLKWWRAATVFLFTTCLADHFSVLSMTWAWALYFSTLILAMELFHMNRKRSRKNNIAKEYMVLRNTIERCLEEFKAETTICK